MKNTTYKIIAISILIYVSLWSWVNREQIIPKENNSIISLLSDTEMIKNSPFPNAPYLPIALAYEAFTLNSTWKSYTSSKGIKVVKFSGELLSNEIRDKLLSDAWDKKIACDKLPIVKNFLLHHNKGFLDHNSFHMAIVKPDDNQKVVTLDGFQEAANEYVAANKLHFKSKVTIQTQFLMHLQTSNKSLKQQFRNSDFSIGYSGYKIADGLFSQEEINNNDIPKLIREK
ncbi:MAG: hypothetical protein P9L95_10740 [Candidatus Tenebribacter mawsonii]|nr:hypothetical protein [Candidatus Tenebribacter mawsonii]